MFAQVALPIALQPLTYHIPPHLLESLRVGTPVTVPLRKKRVTGYVSRIENEGAEAHKYEMKDIIEVAEDLPALDGNYLRFLQWISDYYHYPLGEVIESAMPPSTRLKKTASFVLAEKAFSLTEEEELRFAKRGGKKLQLIQLLREEKNLGSIPKEFQGAAKALIAEEFIIKQVSTRAPKFIDVSAFPNTNTAKSLSEEQSEAYETIRRAADTQAYSAFLLQGVTGSGKTEVYLSLAEYVLAKGKGVLFLVPEIALTPQLLARVQNRLGQEIAVMHSGLTDTERCDQWHLIHSGRARVVLGARSTIFAPLKNIGLIVVDEEHETAFKQEDRLRYNARDMALLRGTQEKATVILGSATPSLESFHHVLSGKLKRLELCKRFSGNALPKIEVVDLKREKLEGSLSGRLVHHLRKALERKKQAILFLNRRGFASFQLCKGCGNVPECPNCSVSLTHYKHSNSLQCHYCGYHADNPEACAACGSKELNFGGLGTESLEVELRALFPEARIVRIDRETTQKRGDLEKKLRSVANHEYDFIIGTQMIAKGHDFPNIELAAIVNADVTLNVPDFRSSERAFQLFTQVAGRAGRGGWASTVLLQTYDPENPAIVFAKNNAFEDFARMELAARSEFRYPPYYRLARIVISDSVDARARAAAFAIMEIIRRSPQTEIEAIGPAPAVLHKLLNRFRWNILLKTQNAPMLNSLIKSNLPLWKEIRSASTNISIDVDPVSLM